MLALTIYSRPGCHLCDEMKAIVRGVAEEYGPGVAIEDIDISRDQDLESRYGRDIPVLMLNGRKIAKYRISTEELRRAIASRGD